MDRPDALLSPSGMPSESAATTLAPSPTVPSIASLDALSRLLARQSAWPLDAPAPDDAALGIIFDMALRAPDHGRLRPWRFVVIRGEARHALGQVLVDAAAGRHPDAGTAVHEGRRQKALAAPVIIAMATATTTATKVPEIEQMMAVGAAAMNMLNAIHLLGFGGFWATGPDTYDRNVHHALGFTETEKLAGFLFVGTRRDAATPVQRPPRASHVREWLGPSSTRHAA